MPRVEKLESDKRNHNHGVALAVRPKRRKLGEAENWKEYHDIDIQEVQSTMDKPTFNFLGLPRELRDQAYSYLVPAKVFRSGPIIFGSWEYSHSVAPQTRQLLDSLGFNLHINHQIWHESREAFYRDNIFCDNFQIYQVTYEPFLWDWSRYEWKPETARVRHLCVRMKYFVLDHWCEDCDETQANHRHPYEEIQDCLITRPKDINWEHLRNMHKLVSLRVFIEDADSIHPYHIVPKIVLEPTDAGLDPYHQMMENVSACISDNVTVEVFWNGHKVPAWSKRAIRTTSNVGETTADFKGWVKWETALMEWMSSGEGSRKNATNA
ncbi:hypothetical protein GQ43DRAFT_465786 [Delitschia confertaspora ATCC 74209]|uniref:Uncharacterized protein n=1 Tax=Delitschia confertaspora ATCC 74209 TaxID=1513339 RepID=A0A9P4JHS0_9PLEO|nr:hypothetical protein GQ43DRAFT_465786 [Delitschia confertaspora ATCC 74209]